MAITFNLYNEAKLLLDKANDILTAETIWLLCLLAGGLVLLVVSFPFKAIYFAVVIRILLSILQLIRNSLQKMKLEKIMTFIEDERAAL